MTYEICNMKYKKKKKLHFKMWMLASRAQPRLTEVWLTQIGLEHALPLPSSYWLSVKRKKIHVYSFLLFLYMFSFIFITTISKKESCTKGQGLIWDQVASYGTPQGEKDHKKTNRWCANKQNEKHRHKMTYVAYNQNYQCSWLLFACLDYC